MPSKRGTSSKQSITSSNAEHEDLIVPPSTTNTVQTTASPRVLHTDASAIRAAVSKDMRVFTRDGCPRLADILDRDSEVWSGRRWIVIHVSVVSNMAEFYRIKLDDGTCMVCTADQSWAIVANGKLSPVKTKDLRTDLSVSPFILPPTGDFGGVSVTHAYDMGEALGTRMAANYKLKDGIPDRVFSMDKGSLGLFVAGWMDSQKGHLFGCHAAIHDLQIALHRLGVYRTIIEDFGTYHALSIPQKYEDEIPNPKGGIREFPRTVLGYSRVAEVYLMSGKKKAYTITTPHDAKARTVVLDGILTLC